MSRSASAQTMFADLPPSSRVTFLTVGAAISRMRRPTAVEPVKATLSTSSLTTSSSPSSLPGPVTTLRTPRGSRPVSSIARATSSSVSGVKGDGLSTTLLPIASAGASFHMAINSGKLKGMIPVHTPIASRCTKFQLTCGTSIHGSGSYQGICSACSAIERNVSTASGTSTIVALRRVAPAVCASSSAQSALRSARCLAISNITWLRCSWLLLRHSPSSKLRRAAAMARRASSRPPAGASATTSSVDGLTTSKVSPAAEPVHSPSMYCW